MMPSDLPTAVWLGYRQDGNSILHLAVMGKHRDVVLSLLTHPSCKSVPSGDGSKVPLEELSCHNKTASGLAIEHDVVELFKPTMDTVDKVVKDGTGLGLIVNILNKFLQALENASSKRGLQPTKVSGAPSVADILNRRYEDGMSILMKAIQHGSKRGAIDLVNTILQVCDAIENYDILLIGTEPPDEVKQYMAFAVPPKEEGTPNGTPEYRCQAPPAFKPSDQSAPPGEPVPSDLATEEKVRKWLEENGSRLLAEGGGSVRDPWIMDVVDKDCEVKFSYQTSQATTARKWQEGQKTRESMPKTSESKFFCRPRYLVNSLLDDMDKNKKTALHHAVVYDDTKETRGKIVDLLLRQGANFGANPDREVPMHLSDHVKRLLDSRQLLLDKAYEQNASQVQHNLEDPSKPNKWHLFMSHAQALSQQSVFEVVRHLKMLAPNIETWTDQVRFVRHAHIGCACDCIYFAPPIKCYLLRCTVATRNSYSCAAACCAGQRFSPTPETMKDGVRGSEKFVFYMGMAEGTRMLLPADNESHHRRSDDSGPKLESVEAWLRRVWPTTGLVEKKDEKVKEDGKVTVYNHPGTIWRFWCLYEVYTHVAIIQGLLPTRHYCTRAGLSPLR
jgi:hypothetical protein